MSADSESPKAPHTLQIWMGLCGFAVVILLLLQLATTSVVQRWEYRVITVPTRKFHDAVELLGEQGWEILDRQALFADRARGTEYHMLLRRPSNWLFQLRVLGRAKDDRDEAWEALRAKIAE